MGTRFEGDAELLHPSKYLKAADLQGKDWPLTIDHVIRDEELVTVGGVKDKKPILFFRETEKGMVLNVTNKRSIMSLHGKIVKEWAGKLISVYPTTDLCGGKRVDCIRVRDSVPAQKGAA
jgi:hypothetical protein